MQKIGIGYESYKKIIDENCYFVDKTMLVRDVLEKGGMVTLITRPRRFGKTLALSILRTFFELEVDYDGNVQDNGRYFAGKKIMEAPEKILSMMGKYPVINLSLKSAKQPNFFEAGLKLRDEIISEYSRHSYLLDSKNLTRSEKANFDSLMQSTPDAELRTAEDYRREIARYSTAIKTLSVYLQKHHRKDVIILLDEYDVPLENAYHRGFYDEMVDFIRSLFESALKTNNSLFKAVVTGCLRISRESLFTGLNNLEISSIRDSGFADDFGFTDAEVVAMLKEYGLEERIAEARKWYDGYRFGEQEIYNPWSITKYVKSIVVNHKKFPEPYWANTSSNRIIREMVYHANEKMREELDALIKGDNIEKMIHEDITYEDIHETEDNLWNFLFFTGYMKKVSERLVDGDVYVTMRIPNAEIRSIYRNQISSWFDKKVEESDRSPLHRAVLEGNTEGMANYLTDLLGKTISTFDSDESFYHGFLLSLLYGVPCYVVRSNREEGIGRPDTVLYPNRPQDPAILFEIKVRKKFSEMQSGIDEAFRQIGDLKYETGILEDGYMGCIAYGICFCKKSCIIERYRSNIGGRSGQG